MIRENISSKVLENIGTWAIMLIVAGVIGTLASMQNGSVDGTNAKRENDTFHPKIQQKVDSLAKCQLDEKHRHELESQRRIILDSIIIDRLTSIDDRVQFLYNNEINKR